MFKRHPVPITDENFPEAWSYADKKMRQIKVNTVAAQAASWTGNLLFLAGCVLLVYGLLNMHPSRAFRSYLASIIYLKDMLDVFTALIFNPELSGEAQTALLLMYLYGIPFAGAVVTVLLIRLVYHPRSVPVPAGTSSENAGKLCETAQLALIRLRRIEASTIAPAVCNMLFLLICGLLVCGYLIVAINAQDEALINQISMEMDPITLSVLAMVIFSAYAMVNCIVILLIHPLTLVYLPITLIDDAHRYLLESDPEEKARFEEEERILQLAQEIRERRKQAQEKLKSR